LPKIRIFTPFSFKIVSLRKENDFVVPVPARSAQKRAGRRRSAAFPARAVARRA